MAAAHNNMKFVREYRIINNYYYYHKYGIGDLVKYFIQFKQFRVILIHCCTEAE